MSQIIKTLDTQSVQAAGNNAKRLTKRLQIQNSDSEETEEASGSNLALIISDKELNHYELSDYEDDHPHSECSIKRVSAFPSVVVTGQKCINSQVMLYF